MTLKIFCEKGKSPECQDVFFKLVSNGSEIRLVVCDESGKEYEPNGIILSFRGSKVWRWRGGLDGAPDWVKSKFCFDSSNAVKRKDT